LIASVAALEIANVAILIASVAALEIANVLNND